MDEAEYCQRISIMVDGKIEALNSPGNLRKEFRADNIEDIFVRLARGSNNN